MATPSVSKTGTAVEPKPTGRSRVNSRAATWTLLAGVTLLGLGLRLYCLDCFGFWGDEVASLEGARLGLETIFTNRFGWLHVQTPGHYLLVWLTSLIADPASTAVFVRLPSAVAGALTPLAVYGLGREILGWRTALLGALLVSLAPVSLNYSQDIRPYAILTLLTILQAYFLVKAEKTGRPAWWAAFTLATIANLLNAYVALTLVLPALMPYLLWVLWSALRSRKPQKSALLSGAISALAIAIVGVLVLIDMLQVPRVAPDLSRFAVTDVTLFTRDLLNWFAQTALNGTWAAPVQLVLLLLALAGTVFAVQNGKQSAAILCWLCIVTPAGILAFLSTTNTVFQRYALFAMPFYFLLAAHGATYLMRSIQRAVWGSRSSITKWLAAVVPTVVIAPFLLGALAFSTPDGHVNFSYRPDFRSASSFLAENTHPQDMIVFVDYPALGRTISGYYDQQNKLAARTFDARDPRLGRENPAGDIYWVVSAEDTSILLIVANERAWDHVVRLDGVVILRQRHPTSVVAGLENLVDMLERNGFPAQPAKTLRGSIVQMKGKAVEASEFYIEAGTYFPTGDEYLRTAQGYEALADDQSAWREAVLSKFWQPQRPEVHQWLARKLHDEGYENESKIEGEIATLLKEGR